MTLGREGVRAERREPGSRPRASVITEKAPARPTGWQQQSIRYRAYSATSYAGYVRVFYLAVAAVPFEQAHSHPHHPPQRPHLFALNHRHRTRPFPSTTCLDFSPAPTRNTDSRVAVWRQV
eukprot:3932132-Rhodomonas_salina.2